MAFARSLVKPLKRSLSASLKAARASTYTQSVVDNQSNARLVNGSYTSNMADSKTFTFSAWLGFNTPTPIAAHRILQITTAAASGLFLLTRTASAGTLSLTWGWDGVDYQLASTVITGDVSDGLLHHIYIEGDSDLHTKVYVDGVESYAAAPAFSGVSTAWSQATQIGICSGHAGGNVGDYLIADLYFRTGYRGTYSNFYNGGTPPDISTAGALAELFISGDATVWNGADPNSGVGLAAAGGPTLTLTNTFADV